MANLLKTYIGYSCEYVQDALTAIVNYQNKLVEYSGKILEVGDKFIKTDLVIDPTWPNTNVPTYWVMDSEPPKLRKGDNVTVQGKLNTQRTKGYSDVAIINCSKVVDCYKF